MGIPASQLARSMTVTELLEYVAYDRLHPLPEPWLQTGVTCSVIANVMTSKGHRYKPENFMPKYQNTHQTPEFQEKALDLLFGDRLKVQPNE